MRERSLTDTRRASVADPSAVAVYKHILQEVLYRRPSGTRQRLAEALGNNASFISQITNPAYSVPIPPRHVETILDVCRFSPGERARFLDAYARAHPRSTPAVVKRATRWREARIRVPELHSPAKNSALADALTEIALSVARLLKDDRAPLRRAPKGADDEEVLE
jgi:hypothetical protein